MEGIRNIMRVRLQIPLSDFQWSAHADWRFPSSNSLTLHANGVLNLEGYPDRNATVTITSVAAHPEVGVSGTMMISFEPRIGDDSVNVYMDERQFRALLDCRLSARNFLAELLVTGGVDTPRHPDDDYHVYEVKMFSTKLTELKP